MDPSLLIVAAGSVLAGGGIWAAVVKFMNRDVDEATVVNLRAEAKKMAQETAASEVGLLREIIAEVRISEQDKTTRITRLEDQGDLLRARLDRLEERERHMLTRAAVHEAWDQLAFSFIAGHDANFPSPPPLVLQAVQENPGGDVDGT